MLTELHISGLAIIESLSIEFSPSFNVITGETGAGKSILIKALTLLLGGKASSDTVRQGHDAGSVCGVFELSESHPSLTTLRSFDIPFEVQREHTPVLVRRSVSAKGRSQAWINDVPVTNQVLREFSASLIDIFGQNENLKLLDPTLHVHYLDHYLKDKTVLDTYRQQYAMCLEDLRVLAQKAEGYLSRQRDADYLAYRAEELRKFAPSREDYDSVLELCKRAEGDLQFAQTIEQVQSCLESNADGESVSAALWHAAKLLTKVEDSSGRFQTLAEEAKDVASRVDELTYQIGRSMSELEIDENQLEQSQERLAGYQELFRKFAVTSIEQLLEEQQRLENDLSSLESTAYEIERLLVGLKQHIVLLKQFAGKLTKTREKAKAVVCSRVERELRELAMGGARLNVEMSPVLKPMASLNLAPFGEEVQQAWFEIADVLSGLNEHGSEKVQFLLASNPGESMLPLHKVASGGEVSRIMLALKKGLAAGGDTCILVFDEIDTGISGRVADMVGHKMRELSGSFQVICISHLAQVAAHAQNHFLVKKFSKGKRTESAIVKLDRRESAEEVARLLSGEEVTTSSLANAKALIKKAQSKSLSNAER